MSRIDEILINQEEKSFFKNYITSENIGKKIHQSFIKFFKEGKGFPLDNEYNERYGVISNCMALSTLLELDALGTDVLDHNDKFKFLIEYIFDSIYHKGITVFDASPYIFNEDFEEFELNTYIETVSKVCITMIDLRSYALKKHIGGEILNQSISLSNKTINSFEELAEQAEKLMIASINVLNNSCLETKSNEKIDYSINGILVGERNKLPSKIKYRGWTFHKPEANTEEQYDISIYFTYHATNAFVSLYKEFEDLFEEKFSKTTIDINKYNKPGATSKFERDKAFFENNLDSLRKLRERTSSAGRYIEYKIRERDIDLSFDYVRGDLKKVSITQVLESQKNNYVIDTLFILAIYLNAGIDEDYRSVNQGNYFDDLLQYSLTNIKKVYGILKRNKKHDLISSYRLSFTEKYPNNEEFLNAMSIFRKKCETVAVYDLVPLFCNTHATMSDFVIRYPQKDMINNLELIMENRAYGDDNWYWGDNNQFNVNNNLYYIAALQSFYTYYKTYELPYSEVGKEYNAAVEDVLRDLDRKNEQYDELKEKYNILLDKYENKKSKLDIEVSAIALNVFSREIDRKIENYFKCMLEDSYEFFVDVFKNRIECDVALDKHEKANLLFKISNSLNCVEKISAKERQGLTALEIKRIEQELISENIADNVY